MFPRFLLCLSETDRSIRFAHSRMIPLIGSHKNHVRRFASEALGFLFRKLDTSQLAPFVAHVGILVRGYTGRGVKEPGYVVADGIAELVAEAGISINGTLSSKGNDILAAFVAEFLFNGSDEPVPEEEPPIGSVPAWAFMLLTAFANVFKRLQGNGTADMAALLGPWADELGNILGNAGANTSLLDRVGLFWRIGALFAVWDSESVHKDAKKWFKRMSETVGSLRGLPVSVREGPELYRCVMDVAKFAARLLQASSVTEGIILGGPFLEGLFKEQALHAKVPFAVSRLLSESAGSKFQRTSLAMASKRVISLLTEDATDATAILALWDVAKGLEQTNEASRTITSDQGLLEVSPAVETALLSSLDDWIAKLRTGADVDAAARLSALLSCLLVVQMRSEDFFRAFSGLFDALRNNEVASASDLSRSGRAVVLGQTIDCLLAFCGMKKSYDRLLRVCDTALEFALSGKDGWKHDGPFLEALASAVESLRAADGAARFAVSLHQAYAGLGRMLSSGDNRIRRSILRILAVLEDVEVGQNGGTVAIFKQCLEAENIPATVTSIREKSTKLASLEVLQGGTKIDKKYRQVIARYCFGVYIYFCGRESCY